MLRLAWRQSILDPARSLLTAVALGAVISIILVLEGFEQGLYDQSARAVLNRHADLIVAQAGVSNLLAARSLLPQLSREQVESVAGVVTAHPVTGIPVIYEQDGKKAAIAVFVYDTRGGPVKITEGRGIQEGREAVVDHALAAQYGMRVGDPFVVSEFEFTVVGISEDETALLMPFAFINYDGMIDLFLESEIAPDLSTFPLLSFMFVELTPGADRNAVAQAIETRVPSGDVFTPQQMAQNDVNLGRSLFGPIMGLLVTVSYIIGLLVVGLIMYADVCTRLRDFGVLKALGFKHRALGIAVLLQTLLLLLISLPVGLALAQGIAVFIQSSAPVYLVRVMEPMLLLRTLGAGVVIALIGALVPLRVIRRTDPMIAFQRT